MINNIWIDITKQKPTDNQRVLVWNNKYNMPTIQVFNDYDSCWVTEDGDDFEYALNQPCTQQPDKLLIQFWSPLPDKPIEQ